MGLQSEELPFLCLGMGESVVLKCPRRSPFAVLMSQQDDPADPAPRWTRGEVISLAVWLRRGVEESREEQKGVVNVLVMISFWTGVMAARLRLCTPSAIPDLC